MKKLDGDGMVYKPAYVSISQDEAKLMMKDDDGHVIVDVRRADEYAQPRPDDTAARPWRRPAAGPLAQRLYMASRAETH